MSKFIDVLLSRVAPTLFTIIGWFILRTVNSIDQRLIKVEELLVDVPVMQERVAHLSSASEKQESDIRELYRLYADLPRNTFDIREKKK